MKICPVRQQIVVIFIPVWTCSDLNLTQKLNECSILKYTNNTFGNNTLRTRNVIFQKPCSEFHVAIYFSTYSECCLSSLKFPLTSRWNVRDNSKMGKCFICSEKYENILEMNMLLWEKYFTLYVYIIVKCSFFICNFILN